MAEAGRPGNIHILLQICFYSKVCSKSTVISGKKSISYPRKGKRASKRCSPHFTINPKERAPDIPHTSHHIS